MYPASFRLPGRRFVADGSLQFRVQFVRGRRLGEVVVGAHFEADGAVAYSPSSIFVSLHIVD